MSAIDTFTKIKSRQATVGVIGLGFIGPSTASF
jgi:UDP-N-acetyl-D-mannosaminuronate dehydrogenase